MTSKSKGDNQLEVILLDAESHAKFEELVKSPPKFNAAMLQAMENVKGDQFTVDCKCTDHGKQP